MNKTSFTFAAAVIAAAAAFAPTTVSAQLSLPGFGAKADPKAPDAAVQQDQLVKSYTGASGEVMTANSKMLLALGDKDASDKAKLTADAYTSGATKGNLEDADKAANEQNAALVQALAQKRELDADAKAKFADALVTLVSGMTKYVGMQKAVADFSTSLKSASVLQMPKLRAGAYVATSFPTGMHNLGTTLKSAVAFAKTNNIKVPANANSVL
jgi:hypothetical protein